MGIAGVTGGIDRVKNDKKSQYSAFFFYDVVRYSDFLPGDDRRDLLGCQQETGVNQL